MLKDHKSLKELVLGGCQVGDVGAKASGFCYFDQVTGIAVISVNRSDRSTAAGIGRDAWGQQEP